eukprot:9894385-Alexandrium_andersonii.AAC.1
MLFEVGYVDVAIVEVPTDRYHALECDILRLEDSDEELQDLVLAIEEYDKRFPVLLFCDGVLPLRPVHRSAWPLANRSHDFGEVQVLADCHALNHDLAISEDSNYGVIGLASGLDVLRELLNF